MWTYTQVVPAFFAALCAAFFAFALVQRWRHDSYVDEADPTAPLFVAILRLGIIYVILASGILLAISNAVDPCISLARVGQHGANDHRLRRAP